MSLTSPVRHSGLAERAELIALPPPAASSATHSRKPSRGLRRILVATDGTAASEGALAVARLLARRDDATLDVLTVLPRWGPRPPAHAFLDMTRDLIESRLARVIPQSVRALGDGRTRWSVRLIDSTSIAASIAETAGAESHDLIVTGVRSGWIDRWLRSPTALAVAQRTTVPVLAVPPSVAVLPSRAVVGADGTDGDITMAASMVGMLAELSAVHLVHVRTADNSLANGRAGVDARPIGWAPRFARIERALDAPEATDVKRCVLPGGEPAARLLAYARLSDADLIVVGTRRPMTLRNRVFGGVSRRILRTANCLVLLAGLERADADL